jgi:hypothetical protein
VTEPIDAVAPPPAGRFGKGLAAGVAAALVGAVVGALITVNTNHRIGLVYVGIGVLVGVALERLGGGDRRLPYAGVLLALVGCALADLAADAHILGRTLHVSTFEIAKHPRLPWKFYTDGFRVFDGIFYAIAAFEGFWFARRGAQRAKVAAAADQPPSIEVPGDAGAGPGLGTGLDPSAPLGSAAETSPAPAAPQLGDPPTAP